MFVTKYLRSIALGLAVSVFIAACGGSSNVPLPDTGPGTVASYNGPGSKWDYELYDDGTFMVTRRDDVDSPIDLTVEGDYEVTTLGFVLMTVTGASGTDAPSPGDTAWALEVPGYALMLKPIGPSSDQMIPMVVSGDCPTDNLTGNWVIVRKRDTADATATDADYFGSFAFDIAQGLGQLPDRFALSDGFPSQGMSTLQPGSCANGIMNEADALMYLTDNGGAIVHTNLSDPAEASFIFALAQKQLTSVADMDMEYAGILFDDSAAGDKIVPVSVACTGGICSGNFVDDVANNTVGNTQFTLDLFGTLNAPVTGFITGEVSSEGNTGNLACMTDADVLGSGQQMMSCVGQAPGDNTRMFNIILAANN